MLAEFDPRAIIRETLPANAANTGDDTAKPESPQRGNEASPLVFLGDRFGNHLALVYNRHFINAPPQDTDELVPPRSRTRSTRTATAA